MEYNILKHMRQRHHQPTHHCLTVKFYLAIQIVLIITLNSRDVLGSPLGSKCQHDMDCTDFIKGSSCSALGYCECAPYYVQYNTTTCLSSQLLGGDCTLNEQCTMKVANSSCLDGACRCVEGFLQFRKHTCLGPAPPGSVCYSHAHCQMFNTRTHCDFLIPNLFGRCQCTAPAKLKNGLCVDNSIEEAQALISPISTTTTTTSTTTTTTQAPIKETEAPVNSAQEILAQSPVEEHSVVIPVLADPIVQPLQPEETSNVSIEEQEWQDDKDTVEPTSNTPLQGEPLTPAQVDEKLQQHEPTESFDGHEIPSANDDYPYKIEEEEDHTQKQENAEEPTQETHMQDEEHEYGDVVDNTMNFDYEAAEQEMEDHLDQASDGEGVQEEPDEKVKQELQKEQGEKQEHEPEPEIHKQDLEEEQEQPIKNQDPEEDQNQEHISQQEQIQDEHSSELEQTVDNLQFGHEQEPQQHHETQSEEHVQQDEHEPQQEDDLVHETEQEKDNNNNSETAKEQEHEQQNLENEQLHDQEHGQQTPENDQEHETVHKLEEKLEPENGQQQSQVNGSVYKDEDVNGHEQEQPAHEQELEQVQPQKQDAEFEHVNDSEPELEHVESNEFSYEQEPEPENDQVQSESELQQDYEPEHIEEHQAVNDPEQIHEAKPEQEQELIENNEVPFKKESEQAHDSEKEQENDESEEVHETEQEQEDIENDESEKEQEHKENNEAAHKKEPEQLLEPEKVKEHVENHESEYEQTTQQGNYVHEEEKKHEESNEHNLETEQQPQTEHDHTFDVGQELAKEHEEINQHNADEEVQDAEHQDEIKEHEDDENNENNGDYEDSAEQQHIAEQDHFAQLDHIISDNDEINNKNIPHKHQEDSQEESLNESLNSQSITNEIHHDHIDNVVAENESVQNKNEATTQQQPEAIMLANDEVITTQSAVQVEEDKKVAEDNNNIEINLSNSQEQQLLVAAESTLNDEEPVDNDEEKFVSQPIYESNTAGQIADTSVEKQQNEEEILQQTTEKIPEDKHTDNYTQDSEHPVFEDFTNQHEITTEQTIETDKINHNVIDIEEKQPVSDDKPQKPIILENLEEQPITVANIENISDQVAEEQNVVQDVLPNEILPAIGSESEQKEKVTEQPSHLEETSEEEQTPQKIFEVVEQDDKEPQHLVHETLNDLSLEDSLLIENDIYHEEDNKEENEKEIKNEISQIEHSETEALQEQKFQESLIPHLEETVLETSEQHLVTPDTHENENLETIDDVKHSDDDKAVQHQETMVENAEENQEESTTLSTQLMQHETSKETLENNELIQTNEVAVQSLEGNEFENQKEPEPIVLENYEDEHQKEDGQTLAVKNEEQESEKTSQIEEAADEKNSENETFISNEDEQVTEAIESNYVPSNELNEELTPVLADSIDDNEEAGKQPHDMEAEYQDSASNQASIENNEVPQGGQHESEENVYENQPGNVFLTQDKIIDVGRPENELFKESESISDILNNLMKEDVTMQPEYSEESNFNSHLHNMHENDDGGDLLAEDTNISEESVMSQQLPTQISTEAPIDPEDKLITFYPDMQEMQPVQQQPITSQEYHPEAVEEASGDNENSHEQDNEIIKTEGQKEHHTLSPLDLPFDTSVDYEPQQFEADSLIVETTTISPSDLKLEENNEQAESTTTAGSIDELTTQTMLNLASRVTLMEPAAPIVTTLKPLMQLNANDEVTALPSIDAPTVESLLTTKPTTEIRKRVELSLEAVSLGLSCSTNKQCQLADPYTVCNARGVCDCVANVYSAQVQNNAAAVQCGAERTGCSPGTFQCRSSGVCISWFFVCDGRSDCNDASDEECTFNARLNQTCPSEAFQCTQSGRCISRAALCDGRKQCPHGEDEIGCSALKSDESCPPHTFSCKSGECLPEYEYCNAIISCRDGSDEPPHMCGSRSMPNFFLQLLTAGGLMNKNFEANAYCPHRCSNGRCRSTAIVCSGRDGCGDGTDEQTCSVCRCPAINLDRPAINVSEFLARRRPMPLW